MRRLEIIAYGDIARSVHFAEVPEPTLADDEVLIRVEAASINPIDTKFINGHLRRIMAPTLPAAIGFDACGHIEKVGAAVRGLGPGERVYLRAPRQKMGSFAEYLAVAARFVAPAPRNLSAAEAASIPLVALTTVQGLVDRAQAEPGQRILIHAGSGGLGSFAVQYAKHVLGLVVTTTASSRNSDWVARLGADTVIEYDREDYRRRDARYDIVFDTLGGETTRDAFALLRRGGCVVSVAGPPDWQFARQIEAGALKSALLWAIALPMEWRARRHGARYYRFLTESDGARLTEIAEVLDAGKVKPVIDSVFGFDQSIAALEHQAGGHAKGKVIIEMTTAG